MAGAEVVKDMLRRQHIELPSWAFGNSGTRFKVFAQPGVPRDPFEKVADAAQVHRYTGVAPIVAPVLGGEAIDLDPHLVGIVPAIAVSLAFGIGVLRRRYDAIVESLLARAEQGGLDGREDILAMMLQSRYDDGSAMGHSEIADQLLTLLSAGHETTATTLAWTVERLRRHPRVLDALERSDRELQRIASAARDRTLSSHTAAVRARELVRLLEGDRWRQMGAA